MQIILTANQTFWNALEAATQQDIAMSGKNVEWGRLQYESNVDRVYNEQRKGSVREHPPNRLAAEQANQANISIPDSPN